MSLAAVEGHAELLIGLAFIAACWFVGSWVIKRARRELRRERDDWSE